MLAQDLQQHPVTDVATHVDFLRVPATSEITVEIPVEFLNEDASPGIKRGGVLNAVRYTVEMAYRTDNIPANLQDLTGLGLGDGAHFGSDLAGRCSSDDR